MKVETTTGDIVCTLIGVLFWCGVCACAVVGDPAALLVLFFAGVVVFQSVTIDRLARAVGRLQEQTGQQGLDKSDVGA